jgi:hypothetical protein
MTIGGGRRGKTVKLATVWSTENMILEVIIARWCRRHLRKPTGHARPHWPASLTLTALTTTAQGRGKAPSPPHHPRVGGAGNQGPLPPSSPTARRKSHSGEGGKRRRRLEVVASPVRRGSDGFSALQVALLVPGNSHRLFSQPSFQVSTHGRHVMMLLPFLP